MANYYVAYTKSISFKYKAALRSNVTVFLVLNSIFCFVLPFIFAYSSNGFWIKENSYREQPIVKFKYQYLIILEAKTANSHFSLICSTYQYLKSKTAYSNNCSLMKVIEIDENEDGKNDRMKMTLHITNVSSLDIDSFHLILIFDYKLHGECILSMEAMATASYIFSQPIGRLDIISELRADFKKPMICHVKHHKQNYTRILSGISEQKNHIDAMYKIASHYASNNMNVNLKKVYYSKRFKSETADNEPLIVTADIHYGEQEILYKTRFWQLIKWAWVQYFSILALFIFLSRKMKRFVFQNRILQTIKTNPMDE
ncbi:transmembrane protein 231-like [Planococcus citri]|uniref:transmembrane protein 231-like n=1 Tax=Planococcus citri TaxID=170843 RepID=UPI0031F75335